MLPLTGRITEQRDRLWTGRREECPDNCPTEPSDTCCDVVAVSNYGREMFANGVRVCVYVCVRAVSVLTVHT